MKIHPVFHSFMLLLTSQFIYAQDFTEISINPDLKKNAYAVIRQDNTKVNVLALDKITYTKDYVITVFDQSGDSYAEAVQYYNPRTKIQSLEAVYYDKNGKEIKKFKTKDFNDYSAVSNGQMYTDSRVKYLNYTPTQYPYTLHYKANINFTDNSFSSHWQPIRAANLSIEKSSYEISNQTNASLYFKENNLANYPIKKEIQNNHLTFEITNQIALENEDLMPNYREIFPNVEVNLSEFIYDGVSGKFTDWKGLGLWYKNLISKGNDFSPQQKKYFQDLVKDAKTDKEKVKILYKHLQNKTRYVGVQLGIGGLQPFPATYVESKSYGDCKALTNYMQAILDAVGIKSYYTIVDSGKNGDNIYVDYASLSQGDHVILYVPLQEEDIWLETTSQTTAFNHLGTFTNDRKVAIIKDDGAEIISSQQYPTEKNKMVTNGIIKIDPNGNSVINYSETAKGLLYDDVYYLKNYSEKDQKIIYKKKFNYLPSLNLEKYTYLNNWDEAQFTSIINLQVNDYAKIQGNNLILNVIPINRQVNSLKRAKNRMFDLQIKDTFVDEVEFTIELPQNYKSHDIKLDDVIFESEFGQYELKIIPQENNQILIKRSYTQKKGIYKKEKYNEFVEFRKKVESYDNSKILIEKI